MSFLKRLFGLDPESHIARGDRYGAEGEWGLARHEYEKALFAIDKGDGEKARVMEKLRQADEEVLARNVVRAEAAKESGDLKEALAYYEGALEAIAELPERAERKADLEERIDEIRRALDEASLRSEIADFLEGQGTAEFARQRRQWEFSMYFVNPSTENLDDSEKYTTLDLIEQAGELDEDPDNPDRLVNFGMALAQSGFTRRAIQPLRRAAALRPDDKEVHYLLGNLFADEGDLDLAVAEFEKALEIDPKFALAYLYLGRTYLKAGDDEEAVRLLGKAIQNGTEESGVPEEARELLDEARERLRSRPPEPEAPESLEDRIP